MADTIINCSALNEAKLQIDCESIDVDASTSLQDKLSELESRIKALEPL